MKSPSTSRPDLGHTLNVPTESPASQPVAAPGPKPTGWQRPTERAWSPLAIHAMAKPTGAICNLGCSYCFFLDKETLYEGDRFRMSDAVLERYIVQVIDAHRTPEVAIAWQGGEPTLMGVDFYRRAIEIAEAHRRPGMTFSHSMQTNGTLLDDEWCEFFTEHEFLIGLSLDGPRELHDVYRVDKRGRGTFDRVMRGLRLLRQHDVDVNILTTVNRLNADYPLEVYRFLRDEVETDWIQFIPVVERLDEHDAPADLVGTRVSERSVRPDQLGRFLTTIFDEWARHDVGEVFVQTFEATAANWSGLDNSGMCVFNETCGTALALEHNGDLYSCDHFVDPDYFLGNIADAPIDELVASPRQHAFGMAKRDTLPQYCRDCEVRFACHGECPRNRFVLTPDGEPGLNYLCEGYKSFFQHVDRPMRMIVELLRSGRDAADVMDTLVAEPSALDLAVARAGRNDPCPCGSGVKTKHCHGRSLEDVDDARSPLPVLPASEPRPRAVPVRIVHR